MTTNTIKLWRPDTHAVVDEAGGFVVWEDYLADMESAHDSYSQELTLIAKERDAGSGRLGEGAKNVKLIYNGVLSDQIASWIKMAINDGYCFMIETTPDVLPLEGVIPERSYTTENHMGDAVTRTGILYWTCPNIISTPSARFYGFTTEEDRQAVIARFPDLIVNPSPFKSEF